MRLGFRRPAGRNPAADSCRLFAALRSALYLRRLLLGGQSSVSCRRLPCPRRCGLLLPLGQEAAVFPVARLAGYIARSIAFDGVDRRLQAVADADWPFVERAKIFAAVAGLVQVFHVHVGNFLCRGLMPVKTKG